MSDLDYWREELMKAIATEDFIIEGRCVLIRMRDAGILKQAAYDLFIKMLVEGEGVLTEDEDDRLRELSGVAYGHCAPSFRVWNK
ncbi:hypothetical protein [Roseimicrobium gellanilyticum]|uniref:hypothetical protein n=1 Tax=Roseimicrobium gellanilyticum TaxID=748857 RepID=UPI0011BE62CF|nr:hypothetical protein [Roseimicrobium gellanilyticum]